jgi:hypothetical protein
MIKKETFIIVIIRLEMSFQCKNLCQTSTF